MPFPSFICPLLSSDPGVKSKGRILEVFLYHAPLFFHNILSISVLSQFHPPVLQIQNGGAVVKASG